MSLSLRLAATVFGLIFLAELPGKTALATVVLATRKHPVAVFLGAASAFAVQCALAVGFGSLFSFLPANLVRVAAAALFFFFAYLEWSRPADGRESIPDPMGRHREKFGRVVWSAFLVIFAAEWGDLTQLATAALAAKYKNPLSVFLGSLLALWSVSLLAVTAGHHLKRLVPPALFQRAAAATFAVVGTVLLVEGLKLGQG